MENAFKEGFYIVPRALQELVSRTFKPNTQAVYWGLFLEAAYKLVDREKYTLARGQTDIPQRKLAEKINVSRKVVRHGIERLIEAGYITINTPKGGPKNRAITICNYIEYQTSENFRGPTGAQKNGEKGPKINPKLDNKIKGLQGKLNFRGPKKSEKRALNIKQVNNKNKVTRSISSEDLKLLFKAQTVAGKNAG